MNMSRSYFITVDGLKTKTLSTSTMMCSPWRFGLGGEPWHKVYQSVVDYTKTSGRPGTRSNRSHFRSAARPLASWRTEGQCVLDFPRLRMGCLTSRLVSGISPYAVGHDALLILLNLPIDQARMPSKFEDSHTEFQNYPWDYSECARNFYDTQPGCTPVLQENDDQPESQVRCVSKKFRF